MYDTPPLTKENKIIIIALVSFFIINAILKQFFSFHLGLYLGLNYLQVIRGFIFQIVSYPIISNSILEIVFNSLMIWFIGYDLTISLGLKKYLLFLLFVTLFGGLFFLGLSFILSRYYTYTGINGVISAMLLYYAIYNPNRIFSFMLIIPIKAKYFCLILIGISLYSGVFSPGMSNTWGSIGHFLAVPIFIFFNRDPKKRRLRILDNDYPPKYWQ